MATWQDYNVIPDSFNTGFGKTKDKLDLAYCTTTLNLEPYTMNLETLSATSGISDYIGTASDSGLGLPIYVDSRYLQRYINPAVLRKGITYTISNIVFTDRLSMKGGKVGCTVIFDHCVFLNGVDIQAPSCSGLEYLSEYGEPVKDKPALGIETTYYKFNYCEIQGYGAFAGCKLYRCKIGRTADDAMRPWERVEVDQCYVGIDQYRADPASFLYDYHTDVCQIYGTQYRCPVTGINFHDSRFEGYPQHKKWKRYAEYDEDGNCTNEPPTSLTVYDTVYKSDEPTKVDYWICDNMCHFNSSIFASIEYEIGYSPRIRNCYCSHRIDFSGRDKTSFVGSPKYEDPDDPTKITGYTGYKDGDKMLWSFDGGLHFGAYWYDTIATNTHTGAREWTTNTYVYNSSIIKENLINPKVYIGSVWRDADGKVKFCVTNYNTGSRTISVYKAGTTTLLGTFNVPANKFNLNYDDSVWERDRFIEWNPAQDVVFTIDSTDVNSLEFKVNGTVIRTMDKTIITTDPTTSWNMNTIEPLTVKGKVTNALPTAVRETDTVFIDKTIPSDWEYKDSDVYIGCYIDICPELAQCTFVCCTFGAMCENLGIGYFTHCYFNSVPATYKRSANAMICECAAPEGTAKYFQDRSTDWILESEMTPICIDSFSKSAYPKLTDGNGYTIPDGSGTITEFMSIFNEPKSRIGGKYRISGKMMYDMPKNKYKHNPSCVSGQTNFVTIRASGGFSPCYWDMLGSYTSKDIKDLWADDEYINSYPKGAEVSDVSTWRSFSAEGIHCPPDYRGWIPLNLKEYDQTYSCKTDERVKFLIDDDGNETTFYATNGTLYWKDIKIEDITVPSVSLTSVNTLNLDIGETATLAAIMSDGANEHPVVYESLDTETVSVGTTSGEVTGLKKGVSIVYSRTPYSALYTATVISVGMEEERRSNMRYTQTFRDKVVIPDLVNAGCHGTLTVYDEIGMSNKIPAKDGDGNDVNFVLPYNGSGKYYGISGYSNGSYSKEVYIIENYEFTSKIRFIESTRFTTLKEIRFKNCKIHGIEGAGSVKTVYEDCTFDATISGNNMHLDRCVVRDTRCTDALNLNADCEFRNGYVYNLMNTVSTGAHCDGYQTVDSTYLCHDTLIENTRFLTIDCNGKASLINAPIFISADYHYANRITIKDCTIDLFGLYGPIRTDNRADKLHDVVISGTRVCSTYSSPWNGIENSTREGLTQYDNSLQTGLYVSSVTKNSSDVKLLVSNPTPNDRTLKIVTNKGTQNVTLDAAHNQAYIRDNSLTFEDVYGVWFDKEVTVDGDDIKYIVCYDVTDEENPNQIRFVDFTDDKRYTEKQYVISKATLKAIADAIRYKEGNMYSPSIIVRDMAERIKNLVVQAIDNNIKFRQLFRDTTIIPDEYNTGCDESKLVVPTINSDGTIALNDGLTCKLSKSTSNTNNYITFPNPSIWTSDNSEYIIKNIDFKSLILNNFDYFKDGTNSYRVASPTFAYDNVTYKFENCRFIDADTLGTNTGNKITKFDHCEFELKVSASNVEYTNCKFGCDANERYAFDGLYPYGVNNSIKDCYFRFKFAPISAIKDTPWHMDAIQLNGYTGQDVSNVKIDNIRCEMPYTSYMGTTPDGHPNGTDYVNACLFLSTQLSSADDIEVTNSILNGGGYTIYCVDAHEDDDYILTNVKMENIQYGSAYKRGVWYSEDEYPSDSGSYKRIISETSNLYVSSIIKEGDKYSIVASNDTHEDKVLKVKTNKGETTFNLSANPKYNELSIDATWDNDYSMVDKKCQIDADGVEYIVCYDEDTQIRFVDFTDDSRYTDTSPVSLSSIIVTKEKINYSVGDTLDTNDISVIANYTDATSHNVTNFTVDSSEVDLDNEGDYAITVSYSEDGITKTSTISVNVGILITFTQGARISGSNGGYLATTDNPNMDSYSAYAISNVIDIDETKTYKINFAESRGVEYEIYYYNGEVDRTNYISREAITVSGTALTIPSDSVKLVIGWNHNASKFSTDVVGFTLSKS